MKKIFRNILALSVSLVLLSTNGLAMELDGFQEYRFLHDLVDFIDANAKFPLEKTELLDIALFSRLTRPEAGFNGMVEAIMDSLDEHSGYMDEATYNSFMEQNVEGAFSGVGISISQSEDALVVISPIPGSPAEKAGVYPGDILVAVDGVNIEGQELESVREKIVGPEGTAVQITMRRGKALIDFTLCREKLSVETVSYSVMEGIGYLQITSFNETTAKAVEEALLSFEREGIREVILDLRNNPGGELNAALSVCRMLLPKGVIMRVEYAKQNQLYYNETDNSGRFFMAVLVNEGSASASELLAGAIGDTSTGVLIGTKTFGKGTVQTVLPILSGGGIRLTIAEYKTAGGRVVHHQGLTPDIYVKNTKKAADISYMVPIVLEQTFGEGDTGEGVLAVEQRLAFWNYLEEADESFDGETAAALRLFQTQNGLEVTGVADLYTQIRLNDADYTVPIEQDDQLRAAMEYFNE